MIKFETKNKVKDFVCEVLKEKINRAIDKADCDLDFESIAGRSICGVGNFYTVEKSDQVVGFIYTEYTQPVLTLVLFSCDDLSIVKEDVRLFVKGLIKESKAETFIVIGRNGWHRLFSDLEPVATIYKEV